MYIGNNEITRITLGSTDVSVYLGNTKLYPTEAPIIFEDPEVERILLANFDSHNKGYLTAKDCANVTSLANIFKGNTDIVKFNEFKYFTGLNASLTQLFANCTSLQEITFPVSDQYLYQWHNSYSDRSPLYNCSSLTKVDLNGAKFYLPSCVGFFRGCTNLTIDEGTFNLDQSTGNIWIVNGHFANCRNISTVVIPEGFTSISSQSAFQQSSVTNIIAPTTLSTISLTHLTRDCTVTSGIKIYLKKKLSPVTLENTNTGYNRKLIFYVPDELLSAYQADVDWTTVFTNNSQWELHGDSELPSELQQYKDDNV